MKLPSAMPPVEPICIVTLTAEQWAEAWEIGAQRRLRDIKAGVKENIYSGKDPAIINIQGAIGEYAFAVMFDFKMGKDTTPRRGGIDFVCENGLKIDVKHTENDRDCFLRNPAYKTAALYHADVYVLMFGEISALNFEFGMMGYAFHGELMKDENNFGGTYSLDARKIKRDLEDFKLLIGIK